VAHHTSSVASALSAPQQLEAPPSTALYGGEDADWWDERHELESSSPRVGT
jgi:hypothetical protein